MSDTFGLQRFVDAQQRVYPAVAAELGHGTKRTHWMWFIFPQVEGLGHSPTSKLYAIRSRAEAKAYLQHGVLGPRLKECTGLVLGLKGRTAHRIFGSPDDLKFQSSMTLFDAIAPDGVFRDALRRYYAESRDAWTLEILADWKA